MAAAEQAMDDARLQYSARLEFLFEQCRELAGNISRYESVLKKTATMSFFTGLLPAESFLCLIICLNLNTISIHMRSSCRRNVICVWLWLNYMHTNFK